MRHFNHCTFSAFSICSKIWQHFRKLQSYRMFDLWNRSTRKIRRYRNSMAWKGHFFCCFLVFFLFFSFVFCFVLLSTFKHINLFWGTNHYWILFSLLLIYGWIFTFVSSLFIVISWFSVIFIIFIPFELPFTMQLSYHRMSYFCAVRYIK